MSIDVKTRLAIERAIIRELIAHLGRSGFAIACVYDGGDHHYAATPEQALDAVFAVDEASLRFIKADKLAAYDKARKVPSRPHIAEQVDQSIGGDWSKGEHGVLLILGNGEDVISDWNYTEGDRDGFNAAMNALPDSAEIIAKALA